MEKIVRGLGLTKSEVFLANLSDDTFLNLWSYPNVYSRPGKEICDLLIICGNDVIIFSDKCIEWPSGDIKLAWTRWYTRAIKKSADQIKGAERWLKMYPEEIYLDARCSNRIPFELPSKEKMKVHAVCVALGAEKACRKYYNDDDGSFLVMPFLCGEQHIDFKAKGHLPFAIGDVDQHSTFVHVFDQESLKIIMSELDTISDFTRYLSERQKLIRGKELVFSPSESEMIANYLQTSNREGYCFPIARHKKQFKNYVVSYAQGEYFAFKISEYYRLRSLENKDSYIWDDLIKSFTQHVLAGTSVGILDHKPSAVLSELGLRFMARECRMVRRVLGRNLLEIFETFLSSRKDRYTRFIFPTKWSADSKLLYIIMILKYPKYELDGGYEQYRSVRILMLETFCLSSLYDFRNIDKVVGIALDAPGSGGSQDLMAVEADEWTPEVVEALVQRRLQYQILEAGSMTTSRMRSEKYPRAATIPNHTGPNRNQRRKSRHV